MGYASCNTVRNWFAGVGRWTRLEDEVFHLGIYHSARDIQKAVMSWEVYFNLIIRHHLDVVTICSLISFGCIQQLYHPISSFSRFNKVAEYFIHIDSSILGICDRSDWS